MQSVEESKSEEGQKTLGPERWPSLKFVENLLLTVRAKHKKNRTTTVKKGKRATKKPKTRILFLGYVTV